MSLDFFGLKIAILRLSKAKTKTSKNSLKTKTDLKDYITGSCH